MIPVRRNRAFGAWHGGWATAARMLSLLLALALTMPTAGYPEDAAFHAEQSTVSVGTNGHDADPCVALHLHCCPHQAIAVTADVGGPVQAVERAVYRTLDVAVATVFAERLTKPPRA